MICSVDPCADRAYSRGWCKRHYERWQRHGDPLGGRPFKRGGPTLLTDELDDPLSDRFWSKVDVGLCWEWTAHLQNGYGRFCVRPGVERMAHCLAWEVLVGPIPEGLELDHLCRNRRCCNPDHLEPVTPQENNRRGHSHAKQKVKMNCPRGHPYSSTDRRGHRICGTCKSDRQRRRRAASRGGYA